MKILFLEENEHSKQQCIVGIENQFQIMNKCTELSFVGTGTHKAIKMLFEVQTLFQGNDKQGSFFFMFSCGALFYFK